VAMTTMACVFGFTDKHWGLFHYYNFWIMMSASFGVILWLSIGGIRDTINLFRDLQVAKRDLADDGRVSHDQGRKDVQNCEIPVK
jgi:hypothetical protein